jgi:hypothetical protein
MNIKIIQRYCGGYLAISTDHPRIGVEADTEDGARKKLVVRLESWLATLAPPAPEMSERLDGLWHFSANTEAEAKRNLVGDARAELTDEQLRAALKGNGEGK